jgi:hydrogenase/urease accessory protein HupE
MIALLVSFAGLAQAHRVGLSRGEYTVSGNEVASRLTFARTELDARPNGAKGIIDELRISMSGKPCRAQLDSVERVEPDGVQIASHHVCPAAGDVAFAYTFVDALETGHRHVAEVRSEGRTRAFVAYRGNASLELARQTQATGASQVWSFFGLGVEHILTGWDHLAFLLGVALTPWRPLRAPVATTERSRLRSLVLAVTAFTVAHSVTLTLGVLGIAPIGPAWVEPIIALSIAYVGLEGLLLRTNAAPYRMTFAFGLIHGMGFAGALREITIPESQVPAALGLFNAGVEVGQLCALTPVVLALVWLSRRPVLLPHVLRTASVALALGGAALFVARTVSLRASSPM